MVEKRVKKLNDGDIQRVFRNDILGFFYEKVLEEHTITEVCALDDSQPIKFNIEYFETKADYISDDE